MTWNHLHREEAPGVGDPKEEKIDELVGIAPPCSECGSREAARTVNGRDLCGECASVLDEDLDVQDDDQDATASTEETEHGG